MRRFEDVVQDLKRVSLNELIARGILEPAANFNSGSQTGLCCPFCNSGRGDNHTGAGQFNNDNTFFCHACQNDDNGGKSLSTIDLYMHARNISDFKDAVSQMAQEFSVSTRDFLSSRSTEKKSARHDKNINPELLGIVREDIRRAQADLDELPAEQCRCLTPETMKHFGFGFLSDWLHPNQRLSSFKGNKPSPTRRLIIPTSDKHYNAVLLDCDRKEQNKSVWKQHTAGIELFNQTALTSDSDIVVAVEGEVDAASIWQASAGNIAVVGVIGGNKNLLLNAIDKLHVKDKKFLILFDNDAGQDNARRLLDALTNAGYPAVSKIFDDAIPADDQKFFTRKIDANEILKVKGNEFLHQVTNQIISDARADLSNRKTLDAGKTAKVQSRCNKTDGLSFGVSDSIKPETTRQEERIDSMDELITTREAAEILGVSRSTLENWRTRTINGVPFFSADEMHGKTWYYRRERIEQLKSVYRKGVLQNVYRISRISFKGRSLKEIEVLTYSNPDEKVRRFYTSDEVADIFGVDESAVRYWRRTGILVEDILDHNDEYLYSAEKIENFTPPAERKAAAPADKDLSESQSPTHDEDLSAEEMQARIRSQCEWKSDRKGKKLYIKSTVINFEIVFDNDPYIKGLIGHDEFQGADVLLKNPPWARADRKGAEWNDRDSAELRLYLRKHYGELQGTQLIEDMIVRTGNMNSFHPVKQFFESLPPWDGIPRAETLFIKFLRVDDSPYAREVTLNWLTAAVARVYHPGCNYQLAPVLQGAQGIGKGYILESLGGKWYGALIDDVDDPHAVDAIQNLWIVEIPEMAGLRKAELNAQKSFISRAEDNRRPAYARRAIKTPRHCVFVMTCNDGEPLTDQTGNRRYAPLQSRSKSNDYVEGLTPEYVQQIWAEVYTHYNELFKDGFNAKKLELSPDAKQQAAAIAETLTREDGMPGEILAYLDRKIPPEIIWRLMTKDDRRKFFVDGQIIFDVETLNYRRRARGGREKELERDIDIIWKLLNSSRTDVREFKTADNRSLYVFYGTEYREHISAAEIFNECFGNDKRKNTIRIQEILERIDGWHLGARIGRDPAYGDQRKVYYRDNDNLPADVDESTEENLRGEPDDAFAGTTINPDDVPF